MRLYRTPAEIEQGLSDLKRHVVEVMRHPSELSRTAIGELHWRNIRFERRQPNFQNRKK